MIQQHAGDLEGESRSERAMLDGKLTVRGSRGWVEKRAAFFPALIGAVEEEFTPFIGRRLGEREPAASCSNNLAQCVPLPSFTH